MDVAYKISLSELKNLSDVERKRQIEELENLNFDVMESGLMSLKLNRRHVKDFNFELKQQLLKLKVFSRACTLNNLRS